MLNFSGAQLQTTVFSSCQAHAVIQLQPPFHYSLIILLVAQCLDLLHANHAHNTSIGARATRHA